MNLNWFFFIIPVIFTFRFWGRFMSNSSCIIIAITGASASGKSSIASTVHKELCNDLGCEEIGIIAEDSYYKDQSHLEMSERVKTNYDHPSSMDRDLLIQHL